MRLPERFKLDCWRFQAGASAAEEGLDGCLPELCWILTQPHAKWHLWAVTGCDSVPVTVVWGCGTATACCGSLHLQPGSQ